jgi:hypothetical protein
MSALPTVGAALQRDRWSVHSVFSHAAAPVRFPGQYWLEPDMLAEPARLCLVQQVGCALGRTWRSKIGGSSRSCGVGQAVASCLRRGCSMPVAVSTNPSRSPPVRESSFCRHTSNLKKECAKAVPKPSQQSKKMPANHRGLQACAAHCAGLALQQLQHGLGLLVGLRQHGGGRLRDDLRACQFTAGLGVVCVHDAAA